MRIEPYSAKYHQDVLEITIAFHAEVIAFYDPGFDPDVVAETITKFGVNTPGRTFLLIIDDKCEGILSGVEMQSYVNKKRTFQEMIWYVNKAHRLHGVALLYQAEEMLKAEGFDVMIMACLESPQTEKIKELYKRLGFMLFETHYLKELQ